MCIARDKFGLQRRQGEQLVKVGGIKTAYRRPGKVDFVTLKGLVIDKGNGVQANVDRFGNLGNGGGFGVPMDLRIEKIISKTKLSQFLHGRSMIILAGNRL